MRKIAYLGGDGIGPEVLSVARNVLEAAGLEADWIELPIGWTEWRERGEPLPLDTVRRLRGCDAGLFGAITSKGEAEAERELSPRLRGKGLRYTSPILRLRKELDLWANVRPVRTYPGLATRSGPVDLVIFRENTEDLYSGIEAHPFPSSLRAAWARAGATALPPAGDETAVTLRVITHAATHRIVEAAFQYAAENGRQKVSLLEKANVMRATGGLVRRVFAEVAAHHPKIQAEELHIDAACAQVVKDPRRFDVVVATNLFGDIFSDVAAEVAGGLPLAAACNRGDRLRLYEPVHGSAPDIAGKGIANPLGAVTSAAWMARDLGEAEVARAIEFSIEDLVKEGRTLGRDMGGTATTKQIERALIARLPRRANAAVPRRRK